MWCLNIKEANAKFCKGADELWYIYNIKGRKVFTQKIPRMFNPIKHGIIRTIRFRSPGQYLLVMDIDGEGLTDPMLAIARDVWEKCSDGEKPMIKDSGKKGLQLIWKVVFPEPMDDRRSVKKLELLAWELYNVFDFKNHNIDFGPPGHCSIPYVDTSMFQANRKVRGLCTRFTEEYSVPLHPRDDLETAKLRRRSPNSVLDFEIGTLVFSDSLLTCDTPPHFYDAEPGLLASVDIDVSRVPLSHIDTYKRLPKYLKAVVMYDGDIHHHRKRWLVWYLFRMAFEPEYVVDFVWSTCKWSDLNSLDITRKQVHSLYKTYKHVVAESGAFMFPDFLYDMD